MTLLIRQAEVLGKGCFDVLIDAGAIQQIAPALSVSADIETLDAAGSALCPGLRDHHIHLASLAASYSSIDCKSVNTERELSHLLTQAAARQDSHEWLRGTGYHESIAGDIDVQWLDRCVPDHPIRIQHQGGRLWVFNSAALQALELLPSDPLERKGGRLTGRLFEGDVWLRQRMREQGLGGYPDLSRVSLELASHGVTAVTDTTPANGRAEAGLLNAAQERGELLQELMVMGNAELDDFDADSSASLSIGPRKFHLLESDLPDIERVVSEIISSHQSGRNVAFHCVTRVEAMFALGALGAAGVAEGDRIEHASITPPEVMDEIKRLQLTVVTQPHLVRERGDRYLRDVEVDDQPWLYRLRSFLDEGVPLAFSSDAPFGRANPWASMQAATDRNTLSGQLLGKVEAVTAEQALRAYTGGLLAPGKGHLPLQTGDSADLCLLDRSWQEALQSPGNVKVARTWRKGNCIWANDAV